MFLTPSFIERLSEKFGGDVHMASGGREVIVLCPFCHLRGMSRDKSGHLSLNFGKNKGHCVRCNKGVGDVTEWLNKYYAFNLAATVNYEEFSQELHRLKNKLADVSSSKKRPAYQHQTCDMSPFKPFRRLEWGKDVFSKSLEKKSILKEETSQYEVMYCDSGKYDGYVIFPFYDGGSEAVYWQGRAAIEGIMRKKNPDTRDLPMGKAHWLYGDPSRGWDDEGGVVYLVEGNLDCISAQRWLYKHKGDSHRVRSIQGTALSFPEEGKHPSNSQFGKLCDMRPDSVCVLFDPDAKKKAEGLAEVLELCGINTFVGDLYEGDPNEASEEHFIKAVDNTSELDKMINALNRLKFS